MLKLWTVLSILLISLGAQTRGALRYLGLNTLGETRAYIFENGLHSLKSSSLANLAPYLELDKLLIPLDQAAQAPGSTSIHQIDFSIRTVNGLKSIGISNLEQLRKLYAEKGENHLLVIPNFGRRSLKEVQKTLTRNCLG